MSDMHTNRKDGTKVRSKLKFLCGSECVSAVVAGIVARVRGECSTEEGRDQSSGLASTVAVWLVT